MGGGVSSGGPHHQAVSGGVVPSGKHTKNNRKWPLIVDFPTKNGDFLQFLVCLPEGRLDMG